MKNQKKVNYINIYQKEENKGLNLSVNVGLSILSAYIIILGSLYLLLL